MQTGRASRTAEHNALFRALESARPPGRRLFDDPLARRFLTWPLREVERSAAVPSGRDFVCRYLDRHWPGVRTSVVARTRLIDDAMAAAMDGPVRQVVLLGAGYDSRAYRLRCLRDATVFEVDHPDTQRAKQRALGRVLSTLPENVRFVPSDFNQRHLETAMVAAGYRPSDPTVFLWEGVTNYLTEAAVDATLRWCAHAAPGTTLLFTYINVDVLTDPGRYVGTDRLFSTLEHVDEQLTFGIDPTRLAEFLAARGLSLQFDLGAAEYRQLAFGDAARAMRGHEFYRVAQATVADR